MLVTVAADGRLLDRRRVELIDKGLPTIPHHHEAQAMPLDQATALIGEVRASAERHAKLAFDAVAKALSSCGNDIRGVALRECPTWLPPTIEERLKDYRSRNIADWVMYRQALAAEAEIRGWPVHWFDAKKVCDAASRALQIESFDAHFLQMRRTVGPPWGQDHKIAMAAAIVAGR